MTKADRRMAEKIRKGLALVYRAPVAAIGKPARYETGPAWARHHLLTARAAAALDPRTVRTTHAGRRVVMRRTDRLRLV